MACAQVPFESLKTVWFQITGTLCNLRCTHCFISCTPDNHTFEFLSLEDFRRHLADGVELGAGEFYFTGGEPFMHPQIVTVLSESLAYGPTTVLTNGTLFRGGTLSRLREAAQAGGHALEFRLSIDGWSAETNDAIRGAGTFARALRGVRQLIEAGFEPIVTIMQSWTNTDPMPEALLARALREAGYANPRIKVLPPLRIGAEAARSRPYRNEERVTEQMLASYDTTQLLCSSTRLVTHRGVWVCPILPGFEDARMGDRLAETFRPFALDHQACHTCYNHGAICNNP